MASAGKQQEEESRSIGLFTGDSSFLSFGNGVLIAGQVIATLLTAKREVTNRCWLFHSEGALSGKFSLSPASPTIVDA